MSFSHQRCYLPEGGHICTRPKVEGKCALSRADNSANMKKNPCANRLSSFYNAMFYLNFTDMNR